MKRANEITARPEPMPVRYTDEQLNNIGLFFALLKSAYPGEYDRIMPDETTERVIKRTTAPYIADLSRKQIEEGYHLVRKQKQAHNHEWRFIDIDRVVGMCKTGGDTWEQKQIKNTAPVPQLPHIQSKEARQKIHDDLNELIKSLS